MQLRWAGDCGKRKKEGEKVKIKFESCGLYGGEQKFQVKYLIWEVKIVCKVF